MVVSCSYKLNNLKVLELSATPRLVEIIAEPGLGELQVQMRLAKSTFLIIYSFYSFVFVVLVCVVVQVAKRVLVLIDTLSYK